MIALACDHGALELKQEIMRHLDARGLAYKDFGCYDHTSCDYPTGIGVSITANKIRGIRCALLSDLMSARLTREHNDTNMMAMGAGVVGEKLALEIVDTWLDTPFSGEARHQRRIDKVMALEAE